jgi:hypothetical protein
MVIKGDQHQDISDHKEQTDLFAQFYESLGSAVSVHPSAGLPLFSFPIEK